MMKEFIVKLVQIETFTFKVSAETSKEAESIAKDRWNDGEEGNETPVITTMVGDISTND